MKLGLALLALSLLSLTACVQGGGSGSFDLFGSGDDGPPGGGNTAPPVAHLALESVNTDGAPSGRSLPVDPQTGEFQLERGQAFAIVLVAEPSPDTDAELDLIDETGAGDPATLVVTIDRPVRDPRTLGEFLPAGENLAALFRELVRDDDAGTAGALTLGVAFGVSDQVPSENPFRAVGTVTDIEATESVQAEAAVQIVGSLPPSLAMSFEEAPDPGTRDFTEQPLIRNDSTEQWLVGSGLRWVVALIATPNAESAAGFDLIDEDHGGVGDPTTLNVTANVDLGNVAAGENLAAFFHVEIDPVIDDGTGEQKIGLVLDVAAGLEPPLGVLEFQATVMDELGRSSSAAVQVIEVIPNSTLSQDVQPMLTPSCGFSGCHGPPFPTQGLDLSDGATHGETVGIPSLQAPLNLVEPLDPELSYIIHKLRNTQRDVGGNGRRMPDNRPAWAEAQIVLVENWIRLGAKND